MRQALSFTALALLSLLTALATGCGNIANPRIPKAMESAYQLGSYNDGDDQYSCPYKPNVVPDYDYNLDGSGQFTVCARSDSSARILVHGATSQSARICVYPAQVIDEEHVYVKPDASTGMPWHQCSTISDSGVQADFPGISYNAVFIVEGPDQAQMSGCLIGGNYHACPRYSFGKFR